MVQWSIKISKLTYNKESIFTEDMKPEPKEF
jgi:hypothetical protein